MAFAFALPAIASVALPALGTVAAGIGSVASAIPVIGGSLGSLIGTGAGGGIAGALGAGSLSGAATALGTGLSGMLPALGTSTGMSGLTGGLGGLYGGADALLGGMLPNMGVAGTVTPSMGWMGSGGLGITGPKGFAPTGNGMMYNEATGQYMMDGVSGGGSGLADPGFFSSGGMGGKLGGAAMGGLDKVGKIAQVLGKLSGGQAPALGGGTQEGSGKGSGDDDEKKQKPEIINNAGGAPGISQLQLGYNPTLGPTQVSPQYAGLVAPQLATQGNQPMPAGGALSQMYGNRRTMV